MPASAQSETGPAAASRFPRALVVDDERPLARLVAGYLTRDGYSVTQAYDGPSALAAVEETDPELVVLDLALPGLDGIEVCRRIRARSDCYVIMLTARAQEADVLAGLAAGADGYMTKPFSPRELVARTRVLRRRPRHLTEFDGPPVLSWGELTMDTAARELRAAGRPLALTRTEFDILAVLLQFQSKVLARERILDHIWGANWVGDPHVVDVHIARIRRKLTEAGQVCPIVAVRGVGYRLGIDAEAGR
ncbi:MAG: response regulator transcription factor [Propionibacteriaceae bacterium]|nr:response regulator transcription factor [Propionibacteriaceae bacterium]